MRKRWKVSETDSGIRETLSKELGVLPVTAQILINRGIADSNRANSFLSPDLNNLHNPFLLKGMEGAVERIIEALKRGEKIAVWGDYDVDGVTSTALLKTFLREVYSASSAGLAPAEAGVIVHIPDRKNEGYGLNPSGVKALSEKGVSVIITVDCGIANFEEVKFANSLGIDTIVTDHHKLHDSAPPALSVINPLQEGCGFPFKYLAGVGVAFNLVVGLRMRMRETGWFSGSAAPNLKRYLDIVAIGTIADMVPLVDENRILASYGIKELNETKRPGLKALMDVAGLTLGRVTEENVAFQISPRINAAGRLGSAQTAMRLLVTEDEDEARTLARALDSENSVRQAIEERLLNEALAMAGDIALGDTAHDRVIVMAKEGWHPGVTGIVAGRLVERFNRPVVLIALEGEKGKGSVRGVKGCDVTEGLKMCGEFLERYGGHKAAAGFTIERARLEEFADAYRRFMNEAMRDEDLVGEVSLDCVISFEELNERLTAEIERLAPFGCANERPLFGATSADVLQSEVVGVRHLKMLIKQDGRMQNAIAFNMAHFHPVRGRVDIAFYPYIDQWQGMRNLRLSVKDLRPSV